MTRTTSHAARVLIALIVGTASVAAQWPRPSPSSVPSPLGRQDLSGVWHLGRSPGGPSPATGMYVEVNPPFTDDGEALFKSRQRDHGAGNPRSHCLPMGIVQLHTLAMPARYVQTSRELVVFYEANGERREIFTDGRPLPDNDPQPWWNGYSVGRWDGDTLVVETTHFRDGGWLDMAGTPLTDAGRIVERFRRPAYDRMEIAITIEDAKAYRRPFTVRVYLELSPNDSLIESVCRENNHFPRN